MKSINATGLKILSASVRPLVRGVSMRHRWDQEIAMASVSHVINGINLLLENLGHLTERSAQTDSIDLQSPRDDSRNIEGSSNCQAEAALRPGDTNPTGSTTPSRLQVENIQRSRDDGNHYKKPDPPKDLSQKCTQRRPSLLLGSIVGGMLSMFAEGIQRFFR